LFPRKLFVLGFAKRDVLILAQMVRIRVRLAGFRRQTLKSLEAERINGEGEEGRKQVQEEAHQSVRAQGLASGE
jgi:hypothetical protein